MHIGSDSFCIQIFTCNSGSTNWTPRYEIKILTARFVLCDVWFVSPAVAVTPPLLLIAFKPRIFSFFFNFWMDFLVDSVPRNSFITVDPRYFIKRHGNNSAKMHENWWKTNRNRRFLHSLHMSPIRWWESRQSVATAFANPLGSSTTVRMVLEFPDSMRTRSYCSIDFHPGFLAVVQVA